MKKSSFTRCPVCDKTVPLATASFHVETCLLKPPPKILHDNFERHPDSEQPCQHGHQHPAPPGPLKNHTNSSSALPTDWCGGNSSPHVANSGASAGAENGICDLHLTAPLPTDGRSGSADEGTCLKLHPALGPAIAPPVVPPKHEGQQPHMETNKPQQQAANAAPKRSAWDALMHSAAAHTRKRPALPASRLPPPSPTVPSPSPLPHSPQCTCTNCTAPLHPTAPDLPPALQPLATAHRQYEILKHPHLPGQMLIPDFVSEEEEGLLLSMCGREPPTWRDAHVNGRQRVKNWGMVTDLRTRKVSAPRVPLPLPVVALSRRVKAVLGALADGWDCNEANAMEYTCGHHALQPHVDDRQLSGPLIVTLSLAGRAVMTFEKDRAKTGQGVRVHLPQRSLQVMSGESRFSYTHAIHASDLLDPKRVSITMRCVRTHK